METWRVLKWPVPLDDAWHRISADPGQVKACWTNRGYYGERLGVHFWADERPSESTQGRDTSAAWYRLYGTGQPIPPRALHVATCQDGAFVWHLVATYWNPEGQDA